MVLMMSYRCPLGFLNGYLKEKFRSDGPEAPKAKGPDSIRNPAPISPQLPLNIDQERGHVFLADRPYRPSPFIDFLFILLI